MVDNFALLVSHGLLIILFVRTFLRPDLDDDNPDIAPKKPKQGVRRMRKGSMPRA